MKSSLFCLLFLGILLGCQSLPPPISEYSYARAAIDAARQVQAARYSPGYWNQAEEAYRKGRIHYGDRDWEKAYREFHKARVAAEKAENSARLIRHKNGDIL